MIDLEIDLRGRLGPLANVGLFITRLREAAEKAAAEVYLSAIHEWIRSGRAFTPRTGFLESSINWRFDPEQRKAMVYANAPYAANVELGTRRSRPYPYMKPKADANRRLQLMQDAAREAMAGVIKSYVGGA